MRHVGEVGVVHGLRRVTRRRVGAQSASMTGYDYSDASSGVWSCYSRAERHITLVGSTV